VAHSDVTIGTHNEQKDAAGELINTCRGHICFAHDLTEDPAAQTNRRH